MNEPGGGAAPPVERQIASDMIRRALIAAPVLVLAAGLLWDVDGALSAAFAIALVVVNFAVSAAMLSWAAKVSPVVLGAAAMGGYLLRLGVITAVVLIVRSWSWVELVPLCLTLVVTHLGLLVWEARHVSASLAFPAVKPRGGWS